MICPQPLAELHGFVRFQAARPDVLPRPGAQRVQPAEKAHKYQCDTCDRVFEIYELPRAR